MSTAPASPEHGAPAVPRSPDTIAAIATAPGRGGIGVVRVSGSNLGSLALALAGSEPVARRATLTTIRAADGSAIDSALVLHFPAPASFTGEDVIEIHGHGGPVVLQLVLGRCLELGARLAEPGEFTRRAFENGKIDLAQAEAVADLIDAATASAAKSAMRSLQGEFSQEIHRLVDELTELRALTEATLDFPDEEIDFLQAADAFGRLDRLRLRLYTVFARAQQGRLLQGGIAVVLIGQPNVGKSSLLNRLAGDDLAIVTPIAGTTRDAVRSSLQIEGVPLHVIDTAGLRDTADEVERIGIERSWREIERADLAVLLVDAQHGIGDAERAILARLPAALPRLFVFNKIDLAGLPAGRAALPASVPGADLAAADTCLHLSAKSGEGIELLRAELLRIAGWQAGDDVFIARERHLGALREAAAHIDAAQAETQRLELFAEELRLAQHALGSITGEVSADDLLGEIFGRFCIGK
ncbi:tRNA uridine-5-carboxymethylaminomethyl(34) synthesis GTPase MnmE [Rhodocyclus tenuis]|uniref:tRNA uridine-5-carboxymethylaminomethyl(34) synthesis GTPase MnmE n=1 Tax=Rhodocyclus tenuis TaxID=1066 RepID=UPI0019065E6C|nr:tRNA uridine-5-carboxymethylaminomethyl(34) synthesis GTPase MnmE [Rhodocyclus tenuis]MBK1681510.1 tRNA uridine-5-carboxymethylaminomethyl(34) synthesis GTPase MnmE [Rhodocyclus tenuis]